MIINSFNEDLIKVYVICTISFCYGQFFYRIAYLWLIVEQSAKNLCKCCERRGYLTTVYLSIAKYEDHPVFSHTSNSTHISPVLQVICNIYSGCVIHNILIIWFWHNIMINWRTRYRKVQIRSVTTHCRNNLSGQ